MEGMSPALRKALAAAEKNLRPEDLTLLKELLQSTPEEELIGQLQQLAGMQWERMPVDVETFVLSPEYLGLNGSRGNVYPKLLEDVVELFNGDYDEFVGYGGIGWGKTLLMELVAAYMGYQLACLHSPQMKHGSRWLVMTTSFLISLIVISPSATHRNPTLPYKPHPLSKRFVRLTWPSLILR